MKRTLKLLLLILAVTAAPLGASGPALTEVGPGSGLLARIHLTVPDDYETRLIPFDTTRAAKFVTMASATGIPNPSPSDG